MGEKFGENLKISIWRMKFGEKRLNTDNSGLIVRLKMFGE